MVIDPRWVREVNLLALWAGVEFRKKKSSKVNRSCAGDGLHRCHLNFVRRPYKDGGKKRKLTRFSLIAGLSLPRISFAAAEVKPGSPAMGRYSWFSSGSLDKILSAFADQLALQHHSTVYFPTEDEPS